MAEFLVLIGVSCNFSFWLQNWPVCFPSALLRGDPAHEEDRSGALVFAIELLMVFSTPLALEVLGHWKFLRIWKMFVYREVMRTQIRVLEQD